MQAGVCTMYRVGCPHAAKECSACDRQRAVLATLIRCAVTACEQSTSLRDAMHNLHSDVRGCVQSMGLALILPFFEHRRPQHQLMTK
jgi:hypothetical protein